MYIIYSIIIIVERLIIKMLSIVFLFLFCFFLYVFFLVLVSNVIFKIIKYILCKLNYLIYMVYV